MAALSAPVSPPVAPPGPKTDGPAPPLPNGDGSAKGTDATGAILTACFAHRRARQRRERRRFAVNSVHSGRDCACYPERGDPSAD